MNHPVIVTRTQPGADETVGRLAATGYTPLLSPMLDTVYIGLPDGVLEGVSDLIFSSANGVRAFAAARLNAPRLAAWCVGPSTAAAAREAGFGAVHDADGDVHDLARLILDGRAKISRAILHIANTTPAGRLVDTLRESGLDARFAAAYRTDMVARFSEPAAATLAQGRPVFLLAHSARAAQAVASATANAGLSLTQAHLVAISKAAAAPLESATCASVHIAGRPNEDSLLAALDRAAEAAPGA